MEEATRDTQAHETQSALAGDSPPKCFAPTGVITVSDLLTHWAVFDDCRRLVQHDQAIDPTFVQIIERQREFARLGALTRGGSKWVPHILAQARAAWTTTTDRSANERKVAFALGGIAHFAADVILKPIMSRLAQADWNVAQDHMQHAAAAPDDAAAASIREISAYYDCHVFRQVYLSGNEEPFSAFLTAANPTEPGKALESFVRSLFQRALLSCHTLDPDREGIDQWLDRLFARVQPLYLDIELYARVFAAPDPAKLAQYQVETAFYRLADPIVQAARAVHGGVSLSTPALDAALTPGANSGGYGRAVELGMVTLRQASAYWRGDVSELPNLKQVWR